MFSNEFTFLGRLSNRLGPKWNGAAITQGSTNVQMGVSGLLPKVLWGKM